MNPKVSSKPVVKKAENVSKTVFVEYPKFDLDLTNPNNRSYISRNTGKQRFMYALKATKLSEAMAQCTTTIDGVRFVHVDGKNHTGKVQFGHPVWMDKNPNYLTFMNVKGTPKDILNSKLTEINKLLKQGFIDEKFADERIRQAKLDFCKEMGV